jgi:hypothetical protein
VRRPSDVDKETVRVDIRKDEMLGELRSMGNVTSCLVWCVRPKRLAAYTRQMDVMSPLRAVPEHTDLLAVEYMWSKFQRGRERHGVRVS